MKVWVLTTHYHCDGDFFVSVHSNQRRARNSLADFCCDNWDDECTGHSTENLTGDEIIDYFFDAFGDDFSYRIQEQEIEGPMRVIEEQEPGEVFVSDEELLIASLALQHTNFESLAEEIGESPEVTEDKVIEVAKKLG